MQYKQTILNVGDVYVIIELNQIEQTVKIKYRAYPTKGKINKLKRFSVKAEGVAWMHVGIKTAGNVSSQVGNILLGYEQKTKTDHGVNSIAGISQVCEANVYY